MNSKGEKICTGCGWSSLKPLPKSALACCPDSNYVEKKQTAVDWLIGQIQSPEWEQMYIWHKAYVFEKAKVMHERNVKDAYIAGNNVAENRNPEQYYNNTFK